MPTTYPSSIQSIANPGPLTKTNDPGFELDILVSTIGDTLEAVQIKLGTGALITGSQVAAGAVDTTKLAAGLVGRCYKVNIGATSTTSTTLVAMAGASLAAVVTSTGQLLVGLTLVGYGSSATLSAAAVQLFEQTTNRGAFMNEFMTAGLYAVKTSIIWVALSAGSHDLHVQWNSPAGTTSMNSGTLWALELK